MRAQTGKESHVGSALGAVVGGGEGAGLSLLQSSCCRCKGIQPSTPDRQGGQRLGALLRLHLKCKTSVQASPDSPLRPRMARCPAVISGPHGD